ncbi:uncharacterized protein LOC110987929 [Acanthaster planci]|uniref:Uncharacterized protein LOC110987929 n=1 Tax=Acanthaster planci TaxID=133434 RepID=A0A8B7ZMX4_ACAPL|nr:uncharacterized protein LOC110987929 [Acanthaster planci]XP_022106785.1 uncharacterized protein LOC110987929 [Acanthaster planci]
MAMKNKRRKHLVKQQIGVVITDLEKVISELNTVVRELKGVLNQIERVSTYLDDEQTKQADEREAKRSKRIVKKAACVVKSCENGVVLPRMCSPCKSLSQFVAVRNGLNGTKCAFSSSPQKCHNECFLHSNLTKSGSQNESDACTCGSGDDGSPRRVDCSGDSWCSSPRHDILSWDQRSLSFPSPAHSLTARLRDSKANSGSQTSCSEDTQSADFQADYNRDINTWTTYAMVHIDASSDAWSADEAQPGSEVLSPTHSHHSGDKRIMPVSPLVVKTV